MCEKMTRQRKL